LEHVIMTSPIEINRTSLTTDLPAQVASEIWADITRESIIQTLCRRVQMPGSGLTVPVITGDPEAGWVDETEEKPVSRSTFGVKVLKPYTLAVIEPFSKQFLRDLPALYAECRTRLPGALARKFDRAALGFDESPGSGFETLEDAQEISLEPDAYGGLLEALVEITGSGDGADVTAWALSPLGEIALLGVRDNDGRPLFSLGAAEGGSIGQLIGRPVFKTSHVAEPDDDIVGVAGDWKSAMWGYVEGIRLDVSDQATLTDVDGEKLNLWQRNMIAVRAECEVGFSPRDVSRFVKLTHSGTIPPMPKRPAKKVTEPTTG
jgi:HK97 family phage major capsid protein